MLLEQRRHGSSSAERGRERLEGDAQVDQGDDRQQAQVEPPAQTCLGGLVDDGDGAHAGTREDDARVRCELNCERTSRCGRQLEHSRWRRRRNWPTHGRGWTPSRWPSRRRWRMHGPCRAGVRRVDRGAAGDVQVRVEEVGDEVRSSASQVGGKGSRRASNGGEEDKMDQGGARRRGGGCGALLELRGGAQAVGGEV